MSLIGKHILIAGATSLLALNACNADDQPKSATPSQGTQNSPSTVVATVNGTAISASRVDGLTRQMAAQGQAESPEARKEIIEHLTLQLLGAQEAARKGLDKTTETQERLDLAKQSILFNAYIQDYLKNNPVNDEALKAEYDRIKAQMSGQEYKARHILVENEADAKDIVAKLKKNPKAFETLAKEKSKDPGSSGKGGDLGWFDPQMMVPEFGAAVARLAKGKFTEEPVKSKFGYHVILLEDSRPSQKQIPPFDQVKPALKQQAQQQMLKKHLDEMKAKATITILETPPQKDGKPAEAPTK